MKTSYVHDEEWADKVRATREISDALPILVRRYVKPQNNKTRHEHGWRVIGHPILPNMPFVDKRLSPEENLRMAIEYFESAPLPAKPEKTKEEIKRDKALIKKYVARIANGYEVKEHPGKKRRAFANKSKTMEEKKQEALDYINSP